MIDPAEPLEGIEEIDLRPGPVAKLLVSNETDHRLQGWAPTFWSGGQCFDGVERQIGHQELTPGFPFELEVGKTIEMALDRRFVGPPASEHRSEHKATLSEPSLGLNPIHLAARHRDRSRSLRRGRGAEKPTHEMLTDAMGMAGGGTPLSERTWSVRLCDQPIEGLGQASGGGLKVDEVDNGQGGREEISGPSVGPDGGRYRTDQLLA